MQFQSKDINGARVLTALHQRIDAAGAIQFKDSLHAACDGAGPRVILDLGQVGFLDSSCLGALVAVRQLLGDARRLELAALTPPVARVMRLTRMDTVFTIHARVEDAA